MQALGSLAMGPTGKLAGSNWGTYPATRQIWAKDCFYLRCRWYRSSRA